MYKSVSFNIFDLHLQDIVYKEKPGKDTQKLDKSELRRVPENLDNPIPKPDTDSRQKFLNSKERYR